MKPIRGSCWLLVLCSAAGAGCEQPPASRAPATPPVSVPAEAVAGNLAATLASLPLKPGYYVATDTACSAASHATTVLLRREGIGGARDYCHFERIEQTGPQSYRVTQSCAELQGGLPAQTSVVTWTIPGATRFQTRSADGWEHRARHCEQSQMPAEWQANDIGDMTG